MNNNDLELLKSELAPGKIAFVLLSAAITFIAFFIYIFEIISITILILIIVFAIIIGWKVGSIINKKINHDLLHKEIRVEIITVIYKESVTDYEAGSGALFIPILGNLFPRLWGQKMKQYKKELIYSSNKKYEISADLADQIEINSQVECYFAKESDTFLGVRLLLDDNIKFL